MMAFRLHTWQFFCWFLDGHHIVVGMNSHLFATATQIKLVTQLTLVSYSFDVGPARVAINMRMKDVRIDDFYNNREHIQTSQIQKRIVI